MFVLVAVPVPHLGLLTYSLPDGPAAPPAGARVVVPLGSRSVTGIVVETDVNAEAGAAGGALHDIKSIRPITRILDAEPFIPPDVVHLARWTADYYAAGAGEVLAAVLPPKTRGARADSHKTIRIASISIAGRARLDALGAEELPDARETGARQVRATITPKQRAALSALADSPRGMAARAIATRGIGAAVVARLARVGLIDIRHDRVDRDPFETATFDVAPARSPGKEPERALTREQTSALGRLAALVERDRFQVALLHGVTGSGKTEIYLRLSAAVRLRGRTSLILVPEIALTPAMASIFRRSFGDRVAIQHSALSDGERHDQWQRVRRGEVDVVVGTRSAVFAPLPRLGLVVVDEEHDSSYKQDESPRYNGRDVAVVRAQRAGALAVLGSATPSMESYHRAISGKYEHIVLEHRVMNRPLASVTVVDMRDEYAVAGPGVVLSRALTEAIGVRLDRGEQALVLLNRRGFATAVFCRQCGGTVDCPNCSVSLVVHGEGLSRRARCHYCNYVTRVPSKCPLCAAPYMEQSGFGTERVEAEVKRAWPAARVARLDRDAVRRKGALGALLARLRDGEIDVLVGTQMVAKGHDFPGVTLVGVVSADIGLGMADFRASERTFQLLTQVSGRAGRGERPGQAIVQTIYPNHYSIQLACRQDYPAFYARELEFRRAMHYPPHVSLVNIVIRSRTFAAAMDDAADIVERLNRGNGRHLRVLGPAPAPLGKLRGEFRVQILIKSAYRTRMRETVLAALATRPDLARRAAVDIDPVSVL